MSTLRSQLIRLAHTAPRFRQHLLPLLREASDYSLEASKLGASYPGNMGVMEMFQFYRTATPAQINKMEALIKAKRDDEAWQFLQDVTGVKLHPLNSTPRPRQ